MNMPRAYFEPQNLYALGEIFQEAHILLKARGQDSEEIRDRVARRIIELATEGSPPWKILRELIPMSPADVGLPIRPGHEIRTLKTRDVGHA
jgi:hypothetical protein